VQYLGHSSQPTAARNANVAKASTAHLMPCSQVL
jgi:hypothetical protein